jgi:putative transcriptional regulator
LRSERSLTRQALARIVGVNSQIIGFLERGNSMPSLELAFKISRFFKLPIEAVFSPDPFRPLDEQVYEMLWVEEPSNDASSAVACGLFSTFQATYWFTGSGTT